MNQSNPISYACQFEKCGPIRFISHLDLTRTFHRAFSRSNIPLKFSEGFTPHPKFAFGLPLSVGTESLCEWAAFTVKEGFSFTEEEIKNRLQEQMPEGIRILSVGIQTQKLSEIAFASYQILLPEISPSAVPEIKEALSGELFLQKKNKKGKLVEKNISDGIVSLSFFPKEIGIGMDVTLSASGESYLKPESILSVLKEKLPHLSIYGKRITRTQIFSEDMTLFEKQNNKASKG